MHVDNNFPEEKGSILFYKACILRSCNFFAVVFVRDNIGYPIAECAADGKFILSKPPNTGGLVSPSTVAEQVREKQFKFSYFLLFTVVHIHCVLSLHS